MPVEILQFGIFLAAVVTVALLWFRFVYKARRTGEGDGTERRREKHSGSRGPGDEEKEV